MTCLLPVCGKPQIWNVNEAERDVIPSAKALDNRAGEWFCVGRSAEQTRCAWFVLNCQLSETDRIGQPRNFYDSDVVLN